MLGDWSIDPPPPHTSSSDTPFIGTATIIAFGFLFAVLFSARMAPRFGLTADNLL
jgi:hypothetical protein